MQINVQYERYSKIIKHTKYESMESEIIKSTKQERTESQINKKVWSIIGVKRIKGDIHSFVATRMRKYS